jgi:hypothetical protein
MLLKRTHNPKQHLTVPQAVLLITTPSRFDAQQHGSAFMRRDLTGKDSKPFRVVYEDGDSEWITLQE